MCFHDRWPNKYVKHCTIYMFFTFFFKSLWFRIDLKGSAKQCKNAGKQKNYLKDYTKKTPVCRYRPAGKPDSPHKFFKLALKITNTKKEIYSQQNGGNNHAFLLLWH